MPLETYGFDFIKMGCKYLRILRVVSLKGENESWNDLRVKSSIVRCAKIVIEITQKD